MSLQEKVFKQLMTDPHNNFCFDCGWLGPEYVSLNHGIYLCFNCAIGIHQKHYAVEVSCVKPIFSTFNLVQLKVLINGGNKNCKEFLEHYDLDQETTSKKYNTEAAQFYREKLRRQVESGFLLSKETLPDVQVGRARLVHKKALTPQVKHYAGLNYKDILSTCLEWKSIDEYSVDSELKETTPQLLRTYDSYIGNKETENARLVKQREIEALERKQKKGKSLLPQVTGQLTEPAPDPCLPPFMPLPNEPFGESTGSVDELIGRLEEMADSTFQLGESLIKRIFKKEQEADPVADSEKKP